MLLGLLRSAAAAAALAAAILPTKSGSSFVTGLNVQLARSSACTGASQPLLTGQIHMAVGAARALHVKPGTLHDNRQHRHLSSRGPKTHLPCCQLLSVPLLPVLLQLAQPRARGLPQAVVQLRPYACTTGCIAIQERASRSHVVAQPMLGLASKERAASGCGPALVFDACTSGCIVTGGHAGAARHAVL